MKRKTLLSLFMLLALALAACAPAATATEAPTLSVPVTGETETPMVEATEMPAETATSDAPTEPPTAEAAEGTAAVTISTSSSTDVSEPFLVDDQGRTLYVFTNDTQNSGTSACTAECIAEWPPVVVSGTPSAGTGVDAAMLGTMTRDDGTIQATYNGWPLYYYSGDTVPGDMLGQAMEGVWFLVSGTGTAIQQ